MRKLDGLTKLLTSKTNNLRIHCSSLSLWLKWNQELLIGISYIKVKFKFLTNLENDDLSIENNAKYAISIARKLGATIFLVWEDIRDVNQKMTLTFVAALYDVWQLEFKLKEAKTEVKDA
jgi:hypothetical protein